MPVERWHIEVTFIAFRHLATAVNGKRPEEFRRQIRIRLSISLKSLLTKRCSTGRPTSPASSRAERRSHSRPCGNSDGPLLINADIRILVIGTEVLHMPEHMSLRVLRDRVGDACRGCNTPLPLPGRVLID